MSRRAGAALVFALLGLGSGAPVAGQSEGSLRAELRRLEFAVESLSVRSVEAATLARAASIPAAPAPTDETLRPLHVGALRIFANDSPLPVEEAARLAWKILDGYYGERIAGSDLPRLTLRGIDPDSVGRVPDGGVDLVLPWDVPVEELAWRLVRERTPAYGDAMLRDWTDGPPAPTSDSALRLVRAFEELMFSSYSEGQRCAVGDASACVGALRLGDQGSQVTGAFPTAEDRRRAAATIERNSRDPALRPALDRCLTAGEDAGCVAVLDALGPARVPVVGGREPRRSLLATALAIGGEDAFDRLLASAGRPMGDRLALVAGIPLPELLDRWRAAMRDARAPATPWSWGAGVIGLAWVACFALFALLGPRCRAD